MTAYRKPGEPGLEIEAEVAYLTEEYSTGTVKYPKPEHPCSTPYLASSSGPPNGSIFTCKTCGCEWECARHWFWPDKWVRKCVK